MSITVYKIIRVLSRPISHNPIAYDTSVTEILRNTIFTVAVMKDLITHVRNRVERSVYRGVREEPERDADVFPMSNDAETFERVPKFYNLPP